MLGSTLVLAVIGAGLSGQALGWGLLCIFVANFLNALTAESTPRVAERWRRTLQLVAGVLAVTGATIAFTAHRGAAGVFIGAGAAGLAAVVLIPAVWPTSRNKYPRLFGGTR